MSIQQWSKWGAYWDKSANRFYVRRKKVLSDGKSEYERMPNKKYEAFCTSEQKINEFLERENYRKLREERAKKHWQLKTSFLSSKDTGKDFYDWVYTRTTNERYSRETVSYVKNHVVDYYEEKNKPDYIEWFDLNSQNELVLSLMDKSLSVETIKSIKQALNLFFQFLNEKSSGQIDRFKFTFPLLGSAAVRKYEKLRKENNKHRDKRLSGEDYIDEDTFHRILKFCSKQYSDIRPSCQPNIMIPAIWLSYHYGLRRSESLAVDVECLKYDYLNVHRQIGKKGEFKELKWGHLNRKIPHFYTSANLDEVHAYIESMPSINPDSLTKSWAYIMKEMKLGFTYHNLRNSYCTNLFRDMVKLNISPVEIQMAMGHTDLKTTQKYCRDFRKLAGTTYVPKKKAS